MLYAVIYSYAWNLFPLWIHPAGKTSLNHHIFQIYSFGSFDIHVFSLVAKKKITEQKSYANKEEGGSVLLREYMR
jgi:hypothetical protein